MRKEEIRKEYFKLRILGHTNNQCRKILFAKFGYETSIRTLRRWTRKLNKGDWDLKDKSKRPKNIRTKITQKIESEVIKIKRKTGWGEKKIESFVNLTPQLIKF